MIAAMRRWLLVFLVLLLPLRGWVGEAMAGQMLHERMTQVQAETGVHAHGDPAPEHAHHDGADASHAHSGLAAPGDTANAHGDCGTCAACQVCSSVALSPSVPIIAPGGFSQPRPDAPQRAYTSAEALLAFKPPRG